MRFLNFVTIEKFNYYKGNFFKSYSQKSSKLIKKYLFSSENGVIIFLKNKQILLRTLIVISFSTVSIKFTILKFSISKSFN